MLSAVAALQPDLPVLIHGYDYALPGGHAPDPRHPFYAAQDKWLGQPFARLGIHDEALQRAIVERMINHLYARLERLAQEFPRSARIVDVRGCNPAKELWNDEVHPTDPGFSRVSARFRASL